MKANKIKIDRELAELIPGFMENRNSDIAQLLIALQEGNYENIRSIGHTLKGIGGGYGFPVITNLGAAIEHAAREQNSARVRKLIDELQSYIESVEIVYE